MAGAASKGKGRLALLYTGTTRTFHRSAQLVDLPVQARVFLSDRLDRTAGARFWLTSYR